MKCWNNCEIVRALLQHWGKGETTRCAFHILFICVPIIGDLITGPTYCDPEICHNSHGGLGCPPHVPAAWGCLPPWLFQEFSGQGFSVPTRLSPHSLRGGSYCHYFYFCWYSKIIRPLRASSPLFYEFFVSMQSHYSRPMQLSYFNTSCPHPPAPTPGTLISASFFLFVFNFL